MPPPFISNICSALNPNASICCGCRSIWCSGSGTRRRLFAPSPPPTSPTSPREGRHRRRASRAAAPLLRRADSRPSRTRPCFRSVEDAMMENNYHHAAADSVDTEPSRADTLPRPRFLHYKPNPRIEMYRHGGSAARRLDEGLASESSEESVTTTTDDDLTEEEQEQVQQQIPEESSALAAAPSEAEEAAAVPAVVPCILPPEPALGSPRVPMLTSEPAAASPPVRVLASEPASPRNPVV